MSAEPRGTDSFSCDYSLHSVDLETTPPAAVGIDFPLKNTGYSVKVLGCCNGLMNTWNRVQNFPYRNPTLSCAIGTPLKGALHWATHTYGGVCVIAAFDLVEESFKHVHLPADLSTGPLSISIGVLGDCLCLLGLHGSSEFWIMKEHGVKESWTRVFIQDPYVVMEPYAFGRIVKCCW
ncbi:hypothetical protein Ddye_019178 [Dipteronia dyeriana]|uniref:F-box associated beta-propeller type 1 domain-containing protein n=1 Tax=Dipteronia dyeriana TaxID=168575 RepID=A0AAD9WVE2_9ROSI|nr:hypothetical protein Ddye_019178 [Dipteronia dyeriana]